MINSFFLFCFVLFFFHFFNNFFFVCKYINDHLFFSFSFIFTLLHSRGQSMMKIKTCNTGDDITKLKIEITSSNIKALLFISYIVSSYKLLALHTSMYKLPALIKVLKIEIFFKSQFTFQMSGISHP